MRHVKDICLICKRKVKVSKAIYVANVDLREAIDYYKNKQQVEILFKNSKNPKGIIHEHCWKQIYTPESEKVETIHKINRLTKVE